MGCGDATDKGESLDTNATVLIPPTITSITYKHQKALSCLGNVDRGKK